MTLKDFRPMMERCSMCLSCRWIPYDKIQSQRFGENCPSICYHKFNTNSARGRFQLSQSILDGRTEFTDTVVNVIHNCLACGACDTACKVTRYNLEPLQHNLALKSYAVKNGYTLPGQEKMIAQLNSEKTMLPGNKKNDRITWTHDLNLVDVFKDEADIILFAGCKYSYDPILQESLKKTVRLIQKSGVKVGCLGNGDNCCTGRALQMGFSDTFETYAERNVKAINSAKSRIIVTPCSDCYYTLKREYTRKGMNMQVMHIVEYIEKLINDKKLKFTKKADLKVTYHDPCHLGRLGEFYEPWDGEEKKILNQIHTWEPRRPRYTGAHGIYDAPRNIIKAVPGVTFHEMERIREYSWCCGSGGGCSETLPEYAAWTACERLEEAIAADADIIITACPWCKQNFDNAIAEKGYAVKTMDILELVFMVL